MSQRQLLTVYGWIRGNYDGDFLDDIIDIIFTFYRLLLESKILTEPEIEGFINLLFDKVPNENKKSLSTKLLFRASEHNYISKQFHTHCDNKGPTVTIIQNEHNYVFGGYTSKSWFTADSYSKNVEDPTAFLFGIRPKIKYIPFKQDKTTDTAIWISSNRGPMFGGGADIGISNRCHISREGGWACSHTFDYKTMDIVGDRLFFKIKEYEVFSISVE